MNVLRRRMFQQGGAVVPPEVEMTQQGVQQVMGDINSQIDQAQNFEQMINVTRDEQAPIEQRYQELAMIVGPEDAMQTPESVLALAQPVIENALMDEGIGGLAQEQMTQPVTPEMAGGIMEMTEQPQQPQQPMQPVQQFQKGGAVSLKDYYQENLPLIQEIMGSSGEAKKQAQGQALLDIAQRAFLYGSGVNPASGQGFTGRESEAQKLAALLASSTTPISEQLAAYNKLEQAEKAQALEMAIAQKSAADAAASKTFKVGKDEVIKDSEGNIIAEGVKSEPATKLYNIISADGQHIKTVNINSAKTLEAAQAIKAANPGSEIKEMPPGEGLSTQEKNAKMLEEAGYDPKTAAILATAGITKTMEKEDMINLMVKELGYTRDKAAELVLLPAPSALKETVQVLIDGGMSKEDASKLAAAGWEPGMEKEKAVDALVAAGRTKQEATDAVYGFKVPEWKQKLDQYMDSGFDKQTSTVLALSGSTAIIDEKRQIKMLTDSGLTENVAKRIVGGFTQSDFAEKIEAFKGIGYNPENATLLAAFGITDDMKTQSKIDRLVKDGNKTLTQATQIVLGGLPDKRYIENKGRVWEITDGKITQTYGEKDPDRQVVDGVLLDLSGAVPKVMFKKKMDQVREHNGQVIRITEGTDGKLAVNVIHGDKNRTYQTIGRTVLDFTDPKNISVAWQDEKEDIRVINNNALKFNKDGSYELLYSDPSRDIKEVNGQLVDITPNEDGDIIPEVLFGVPPQDGENWFIPSSSDFVISYDKGKTYTNVNGQTVSMPLNSIAVSSTIAFDAANRVQGQSKAKKEKDRLFPGGVFNPQEFYSVRVPPALNNNTLSQNIAGGQVNFVTGTGQTSASVTQPNLNITSAQVNKVMKDAMVPYADAYAAAGTGVGVGANSIVAFNNVLYPALRLVGQEAVGKEVASAQQVLRSIIVLGRAAFVNNPRFPVYEMKQARELFPDPDTWFQSPVLAQEKLVKLKRLAVKRLNQNLTDIESGAFKAEDESAKVSQNVEIKNLLYLLQTVPYGDASGVQQGSYSFQEQDG